jgi:ATP-dependent RNA helicase DHX33
LRDLVRREGHDPDASCGREDEAVRRCLLSGLFMNTAVIQADGSYRQTAGTLVSGKAGEAAPAEKERGGRRKQG